MRSVFFCSLFIVFFLSLSYSESMVGDEAVPVVELGQVKTMVMVSGLRRNLNSFQVCSPCVCCGGGTGTGAGAGTRLCLPSPCCYAINCNIPNRPFGFCSFTPKTCSCLQCHI